MKSIGEHVENIKLKLNELVNKRNKNIIITKDCNNIDLFVLSYNDILFVFHIKPEYSDDKFVNNMCNCMKTFLTNLTTDNQKNFFVEFSSFETTIKFEIYDCAFIIEINFTKNKTIKYKIPLKELPNLQSNICKIIEILEIHENYLDSEQYPMVNNYYEQNNKNNLKK